MVVTLSGMVTVCTPEPLKVYSGTAVAPDSMTAVDRLLQPSKAGEVTMPIEVTFFGIVILVRLVQFAKEPPPIEIRLSGRSTRVRFLQFKNAQLPTVVTPSPTTTVLICDR